MTPYVVICLSTETVHCTIGTTPAKLMFGRNLRSRLDLILPSDNNAHEQCPVPEHRWCFDIGDRVWVRCYSARKESWELGILKEKVGNKLFKIYIHETGSYCVRHIVLGKKASHRPTPGLPADLPPGSPPTSWCDCQARSTCLNRLYSQSH